MTQYKNLCWIVYESGLIRYWDYSSAEFVSQETRFLHVINRLTDRIYLHPDAQGNIWLMYNNGLFFYNRMERTWKEACGISGLSNFFTCMDLDRDGNVWVGTSKSGLHIIDALPDVRGNHTSCTGTDRRRDIGKRYLYGIFRPERGVYGWAPFFRACVITIPACRSSLSVIP